MEESKEVGWRLCEDCNLKGWSEKPPLSRLKQNTDLVEEKSGAMLILQQSFMQGKVNPTYLISNL